ncbi:MAG: hypothetical protein M1823_004010 [Watsoniomyces obsoletus]|nr:MAG: hypothetical protein M1823_004010 [Watsoniomyces obsoletus]
MASSSSEARNSLSSTWQARLSTSLTSPHPVSELAQLWTEANKSTATVDFRSSRASSIISTRTKTSITTLHDEGGDGVDVSVHGGLVYRIGLDGRITHVVHGKRQSESMESFRREDSPPQQPPENPHVPMVTQTAPDDREQRPPVVIGRSRSFDPGPEEITVRGRRRSSAAPALEPVSASRQASSDSLLPRIRRRRVLRVKPVTRDSGSQAGEGTSPITPDSVTSVEIGSSQLPGTPTRLRRETSSEHRQEHEAGPTGQVGSPSLSTPASMGRLSVDDERAREMHPPAMDTENEISLHYSRILRSIDASHRIDLEAKDRELLETRDILSVLAREAVDIKTELVRTKGQVAALSDPAHIQNLIREETLEAQSFSFPPLKLRHVRTLKLALKRRAERLKKGMDDDLGWLIRRPTPPADDPIIAGEARSKVGDATLDSTDGLRNGTGPSTAGPVDETDNQALLQTLLFDRRRIHSLEAEKRILEAQIINLRESTNMWRDRCHHIERRQNQSQASIQPPSQPSFADIERARREVEEQWIAKWRDRNDHLIERMRRIDEESRRSLQQAIVERDAWVLECAELYRQIKQKDDEIAKLKGADSLPASTN